MSHRVTTETSMKDSEIVKKVCSNQGISFREDGSSIFFTSGKLKNATLDTKSGRITGDTDYGHTESALGMLRQGYSEELYRRECLKQGIQVESRSLVSYQGHNNVVKLVIAMG